MADSYFEVLDETTSESGVCGRFAATAHTVGPWAAHLQHGGPPSALAVTMAQRTIRHLTARTDLAARRVSVDFVGAVPVAEVEVSATLVRVARTAALVDVALTSGGRECLRARVWFVRELATDELVTDELVTDGHPTDPPPDDRAESDGLGLDFGYGNSIVWRYLRGAIGTPGPATVWARPRLPLVPEWDFCDLARTVLIADSGSGVSAELDWAAWSFVNVDLDVHLARPTSGDWILLDARTQLGPTGSALARSTLSDAYGVIGSGLQTLVLAPLPAP